MNEDDTFKQLKRIPHNEMSIKFLEWWNTTGGKIFHTNNFWSEVNKFFEKYEWTYMKWIQEGKKRK